MAKFRAAAKLVVHYEEVKSQKVQAFELLKQDFKERRKSKSIAPGDLNSKYEQDAENEEATQKLYNLR